MKCSIFAVTTACFVVSALVSCQKDSLKDLEFGQSGESLGNYSISDGETLSIPFKILNAKGKELTYTARTGDAGYAVSVEVDSAAYAGNVLVSAPAYILKDADFEVGLAVSGVDADGRSVETAWGVSAKASPSLQVFDEPANSYIVKPGALARINAVKPVSGDALGFDGLSLVWQDVRDLTDTLFTDGDGHVYAKFKAGTQGNAVVAATSDGTVVWSWDCWVADYDPDENVMSYTSPDGVTYVFMDRNLGAVSNASGSDAVHGNFYQFGRKDAFAGSSYDGELKKIYDISGTEIERLYEKVAVEDNTANAVANPLVHYTGVGGGNYSWVTNSYKTLGEGFKDYWGGLSGTKTQYDPCPAGWRVPPVDAYKFWSDSSLDFAKAYKDDSSAANANFTGWNVTIDGKTFFWPGEGELFNSYANGVGSNWPCGKTWSASADADNFRGYATSVSPTSHGYRTGLSFAYAVATRCIKE